MHQARRRHLHRGPPGLGVDKEAAAGRAGRVDCFGEGEGVVAVLAQHPVAARLGAGRGVRVNGAALGDAEALGGQRLDADVVEAGRDRRFNARLEQALEGGEERVLQIDPQCQHAVEELGDRRQLLLERAVLIEQVEAGRVLKVG